MNKSPFLAGCLLVGLAFMLPLRADNQPTAYEKSIYAKARYDVLSRLGDDDFASYCVTLGIGGDTLLKFHDQILAQQTQLNDLLKQGLTANDPQVLAIEATLRDLHAQYAVKIAEARKGLEIESSIAEETLVALGQSR